jgi:hypothetical protein
MSILSPAIYLCAVLKAASQRANRLDGDEICALRAWLRLSPSPGRNFSATWRTTFLSCSHSRRQLHTAAIIRFSSTIGASKASWLSGHNFLDFFRCKIGHLLFGAVYSA